MTDNEVEVSLHDRFDSVTLSGHGVFSKVYRVEKMMEPPSGFASSPRRQVWAVKKSKDPATGPNDLKKRLREVEILQALRGHEHIVSIEDHWVHNDHLYIQTEFCEEGNLKRFLDHVGNKGRLDDFRIWKILLEVTLVSRPIPLIYCPADRCVGHSLHP
jgi:mitosis inhibitor protein kinase SWE1